MSGCCSSDRPGGLKEMLRQDPDVIFVGEMRDGRHPIKSTFELVEDNITNKKILYSLVISIWLMSLAKSVVLGGSESPASYLSASELLDLYSSMYSSIHNMSVSYTNHVEEAIPYPEQPRAFDNLVHYERVERMEQGDKYHIRYSTDPNGFKRLDETMEHAFDGSVTMDYFPQNELGSIKRGRTGRNVEYKNALLEYMLLTRVNFGKESRLLERFPNGARIIELKVSSEGTVRPRLERIAGEWCHVVDTYWPGYPKPASTTWFAAAKSDEQGIYTIVDPVLRHAVPVP